MDGPARQRARTDPAAAEGRIVKLIELSDDDAGAPLNLRLFRRVRDLILGGSLAPGARLPASRTLAKALGISRNSVTAALDRLAADGWVEPRRGSGVRVARTFPREGVSAPTPSTRLHTRAEPAPFAVGVPGLDLFPVDRWAKLQTRCWRTMPEDALREGFEAGWPELRRAIASHVAANRGIRASPEQIFVVTGARAGIDLAVRALDLSRTTAWVEDPSYYGTQAALRANEVEIAGVPVDAQGISVEAARAAAPDARLAVLTPAVQFPTGVELSVARRRELTAWSEASGGWILEDDYDAEFRLRPGGLAPIAAGSAGHVVYVNSFNKSLFPALRVGFLIAPEPLIDRFIEARQGIDSHTNTPNQIVLAEFIHRGFLDDHLIRCREAYAERRAAFLTAADAHLCDHVAFDHDQVGLHFVGRLTRRTESEFVRVAQSAGVDVTPMSRFSERTDRGAEALFGFARSTPRAIDWSARRLAGALAA